MREDVVHKREEFLKKISGIDFRSLVFLDESGCNTAMTPSHAWALVGERVPGTRPMNWGGNVTMMGAIRAEGLVALKPMDGSMKTDDFVGFIANYIVSKLKKGDVVVLDNLRQHHNRAVRELVVNAGADVLYLPPYSPELNPIEQFWSKFKSLLRRIEERTRDGLFAAIKRLRRRVFVMLGFFKSCGYECAQCD